MKRSSSQRGSAIIMLFIAVALFGALAYAFMQGSRGSTAMMTDEQAKVYANQLIAFSQDLKLATKRLTARGCTYKQFSFANPIYLQTNGSPVNPDGVNASAPTDGRCDFFKVSGAGLVPLLLSDAALTFVTGNTWNKGAFALIASHMDGIGDTNSRDIIFWGGQLNKQVCLAINNALGIANPAGSPPAISTAPGNVYNDATIETAFTTAWPSEAGLKGKLAMCYTRTDGSYIYYNLLLAR